MNGGGGEAADSIPEDVKGVIQNLKEIANNHSDDEIYAMLQLCSMDPNEAAQNLLVQGSFHEVKSKRDKRKENINNRLAGDSQRRPGIQLKGAGHLNFMPRNNRYDAAASKISGSRRNISTGQSPAKSVGHSSSLDSLEKAKEATLPASRVVLVTHGSTADAEDARVKFDSSLPRGRGPNESQQASMQISAKLEIGVSADSCKTHTISFGTINPIASEGHKACNLTSTACSSTVSLSSMGCASVSFDQLTHGEPRQFGLPCSNDTQQFRSSFSSSNYHGWSPQMILDKSQDTCPKECELGANRRNVPQMRGTSCSSNSLGFPVEANDQFQLIPSAFCLEEKLDLLRFPRRQHVIIPNHIHVPDSERSKLSFGSFDADFGDTLSRASDSGSNLTSTCSSEVSHDPEVPILDEKATGGLDPAEDRTCPDDPPPSSIASATASGASDISSSSVLGKESKKESFSIPAGHQFVVVNTSVSCNFNFANSTSCMPAAPRGSPDYKSLLDAAAAAAASFPTLVVPQQQPFVDPPTFCYAQFYRPPLDAHGRVSPCNFASIAPRYNGNSVLLPQSFHTMPESGSSTMMTASGPGQLVTQPAGLMQNSATTQQHVPIFRPPGLQVSHFPPNYIPYGPYISPFYIQPPGLHQYLNNGAFTQQSQAVSIYPVPPTAAPTVVKNAMPQFKSGAVTSGSMMHFGLHGGHGLYASSAASYNHCCMTVGANLKTDDFSSSQLKESSIYLGVKQNDGLSVWVAAISQDMHGWPASTIYNLPATHGQHVNYGTAQNCQRGTTPGTRVHHPMQAVATMAHPLMQHSQPMARAASTQENSPTICPSQHLQVGWPAN